MPRLLACYTLALLAAPAPADGPKKYALLVSVGRYDHADLKPLQFAENDVVELGKVLADPAHGYAVTTLADSTAVKPTKKNIDAALRKVLDACKKGDTVVVGLAGHGLQFGGDDDAFFCPQDAKPVKARAAETMVSMKGLYDEMKASHAGVKVLLVDACRNDPKASRNIDPESVRPPAGVAALFSCSAGERAYETDKLGKGHGIFFYHVIDGLKGEAREADGAVTFESLSSYVRRRVNADVAKLIGDGAKQQPNMKADLIGTPPVLVKFAAGGTPPKADPLPKTDAAGKEPKPGAEIDIEIAEGVKMRFCWIPPGEFWMGAAAGEAEASYDEKLQRLVRITKGFWLGKHEVTQEEYEAVVGTNPSWFQGDKAKGLTAAQIKRLPVENVTWDDAVAFFAKATKEGLRMPAGYEKYALGLPTEAQWEYACRGQVKPTKKTTPFHWGDALNGTEGNCNGRTPYGTTEKGANLERTAPVGTYAERNPHRWGLTDMHGNLWEWCADYFCDYKDVKSKKDGEAFVDPVQDAKQDEDRRVIRGGAWLYAASACRSASRDRSAHFNRNWYIGFRARFRPE